MREIWIFRNADGAEHRHDIHIPDDIARLIEQADQQGEGTQIQCACGEYVTAHILTLPDRHR